MKNRRVNALFGLLLAGFFLLISAGPSIAIDDREAFPDMTAAKVVFDVKKDDPEKLLRALRAIRNAHDSLIRQGVQPDVIVSFRGPAVVCLLNLNDDPDADEYKEEVLDKISWNISALKKAGVQMEACSLALKLVGMENSALQPGIYQVENSLISLIVHQNRGYAMVAI